MCIRDSSKTSEHLLLKAAETTKAGCGYPAWFNYDMQVQHLLWCHAEENITLEDARDVSIAGCVEIGMQGTTHGINPVSYTHLDVYKRQILESIRIIQ